MKKIYLKFRKRSLKDPEFHRLTALAARIARLLYSNPQPRPALRACLDDLLGAVYSLMYAKHYKFSSRPQALSEKDIGNVLVRARKMAVARMRIEGKWTAGFYFNNGLFRTSAVYHRALKILTGSEDKLEKLLSAAEKLYEHARKIPWASESVKSVHDEVNNLKHTSGGISDGRDVQFDTAVKAVDEILELIEALK